MRAASALLLGGALLWSSARAADSHGGHAPAPKEAAKPAAAAKEAAPAKDAHGAAPAAEKARPAAAAGGADPMDTLREKLAARLGAAKAPESKSPYVMRVVSKAGEHGEAVEHGPSRNSSQASRAAAAHRASKPKAAEAGHGAAPAAAHAGHGHDLHWGYAGEAGPQAWGELKPEFAQCSLGKRQSPIDIRGGVRVDLEPIKFDYRPTGFAVVDNGHTVQVNVGPGNAIEVMGKRFDLLQFHFHRPSEERIDGRQFDMVAHLVHKDVEGKLAVVAVLLDRGSVHPLVQTVWNNLPLEKGDEVRASSALDLNQLLPKDQRYYTYMGSLTTPPCSEGVLWMVLSQPVTISPEQIAVFSRLYPMNARPIQQASGRLIKQSN
jgi:carbonic anhydrase